MGPNKEATEKAKELWEEAKKQAKDAGLKRLIAQIESKQLAVRMMAGNNLPGTFGGAWDTGGIDMADISQFPNDGPYSKTAVIMHEIAEQYKRQVDKEQNYFAAHDNALTAQGLLTGYTYVPMSYKRAYNSDQTISHSTTWTDPQGKMWNAILIEKRIGTQSDFVSMNMEEVK